MEQQRDVGERNLMFSAVADHGGNYGPFPENKTVVFNKAMTNIGGAYDAPSGYFVAPLHGVYYFTFFFHSGGDHKSQMSLMKNGTVIVASGDRLSPDPCGNAGNAAILELTKDDRVYVQMHADCHIWAADGATSFSGFLIREL